MFAIKPPIGFFEVKKAHIPAFKQAEADNLREQRAREPFDLSKISWVAKSSSYPSFADRDASQLYTKA